MDLSLLKEITVLYVEDDLIVQDATVSILKRKVKKIYTANNGLDGLELFKSHINEVELILTDIEMPIMNGLEMIKEIKKLREKAPIIIITAFSDERYQTDLADEFIVKPVKKDELFQAMLDSIKRVRNIK